jgi:hypothetical protein
MVEVMSEDYFPIYEVEITASPDSIETSPGQKETLTLKVSNIGNIEDTYSLSFDTLYFGDQDITFSNSTFFLNPGEGTQITVRINIPQEIATDEYIIRFYAESSNVTDNVRVTLKVQDEDEPSEDEDYSGLMISIGLIIVIVVVVIILLFLFVIRKKTVKDKPEVQESVPQEPSMAAPGQQFPPPPQQPLQPPMIPIPPSVQQQPVMDLQSQQLYMSPSEPQPEALMETSEDELQEE